MNLNENDLQNLFGDKPVEGSKPPPPLKISRFRWLEWILGLLKIIGIFTLVFTLSFTVLNFPAIWLKVRYSVKGPGQETNWNNLKYPPLATTPNYLVIPKIGVGVPIQWNTSEDGIYPSLEKGVAHYQGTALPGENGNVFIFGHSSYYLWAPGSYKQVFALLDKLEKGDRIYINYQNQVFGYEVTAKKVVEPEDLSVLAQGNQKTLSLMTCVPIGTNLRRLVVSAKEISL